MDPLTSTIPICEIVRRNNWLDLQEFLPIDDHEEGARTAHPSFAWMGLKLITLSGAIRSDNVCCQHKIGQTETLRNFTFYLKTFVYTWHRIVSSDIHYMLIFNMDRLE